MPRPVARCPFAEVTQLSVCRKCRQRIRAAVADNHRLLIRHADCSIIKVVLNYQPGTIILSIEDDGKGFAYEETECSCKADNSGFGLSMMKERVYLLSGKIDIHSKINVGTKIQVEVPITE